MKIGMEMRSAQNVGNVTRIKVNCDPLLLVGTSRIFEDNWLKYRTGKNSGTRSDAANLSAYRTYYNTVMIGKSGTQYTVDNIGLDGIKMVPTANCPTDKSTLEKEFPVGTDLKAYDYGVGNNVEIPLNAALK
jgi:hypothetical protein